MGILRADLLTHSQLSNEGGSIVLDGSGDYLSFAAHSAFSPATADVTFELWFYLNAESDFTEDSADSNYYFFDMGSNGYRIQMYSGLLRFGIDGSTWTPPASGVSKTTWHHAAGVREGNSLDLYLDGKHVGQKSTTASVTSTSLTIGQYGGNLSYNGVPHGYISNFRYVRGVVYRGEFTPPKFELKNIPGTIVLGCQSTSSATDFAITPSTISVGGNAAASSFHPGLKKDITDTGVVFDGFGSFATSTYMVPPSGKTTERNRGRMILFGGGSPGRTDNIDSLEIQSMGNAVDFGSLSAAVFGGGATASSTRGVFWLGEATYTTLEFVTISNSSNSTTFGTGTSNNGGYGFGNQTRGIWALGTKNILEFVTIATTGNTTDFGDQTLVSGGAITEPVAFASPTRGVIAGGYGNNPYPQSNVIEFVTIATTGNATDFGDLTQGRSSSNGLSNSTRGIIAGGYTFPGTTTYYNIIEFVTIATTGNATDFGDAVELKRASYNGSSPTRGVFAAGTPATSASNSIEFITIATTGNASDFGDTRNPQRSGSGCSDSHGGLS